MEEVPGELLVEIQSDLAHRLDIDPAAIEVVTVKPVTWRDGSLDCPEPGMSYLQVLVEGYQILLRAAGQEFDYRAAEEGYFKLCEDGV